MKSDKKVGHIRGQGKCVQCRSVTHVTHDGPSEYGILQGAMDTEIQWTPNVWEFSVTQGEYKVSVLYL